MNSLNAEIINLIIFILIFLVLYFNLVDTNQYLKNFLVVLVIGYFGLVDLKYGLLLFILYIIDLNNKSEQEDFFILNNIKNGISKVGKSMANLGKKKVVQEEEEQMESFRGNKKDEDTKEDFGLLQSVSNKITNNETFKSLKKYAKNGARNILKSIQEEESLAQPEGEEEQEEEEDEDEDNVENFEVRKKKKSLKESLENNFLLNQLKKNDILDNKLENFQGKIANKLDKINKIITKFKK